MVEIFLYGTAWFWALVALELVLLFVFTEYENGIGAFVSLLAFGAALQFLGDVDIIGYFRNNPYQLGAFLVAYTLLGIGWLTFKWTLFSKQKLAEHDELFFEFLDEHHLPHDTKLLPEDLKAEWTHIVLGTRDYYTKRTIADTPLIRHHKAKAIRWASLWPFSMSIFFLKDMIREFFTAVYNRIAGFLQRIADNIFSRSEIKGNLDPTLLDKK